MAQLAFREGLWRGAVFHAHQAAEKALKAAWIEFGLLPEKTHNLIKLASRIEGHGVVLDADDLKFLNIFYTESRYPTGWELIREKEIGESEAKRALEACEAVLSRVRKAIR